MRTASRCTIAGLCLILAGCSDTQPLKPDVPGPRFGIEPEPFRLGRVFEFEAAGPIDGRWAGTLGDSARDLARGLSVQTTFSLNLGATLHLVQSWTLQRPGDAAPITLTLSGFVNRRNGRLVLNGATADRVNVYVRGTIRAGRSGRISVGGSVMFNPQPEPPGRP